MATPRRIELDEMLAHGHMVGKRVGGQLIDGGHRTRHIQLRAIEHIVAQMLQHETRQAVGIANAQEFDARLRCAGQRIQIDVVRFGVLVAAQRRRQFAVDVGEAHVGVVGKLGGDAFEFRRKGDAQRAAAC